ncbi:MAG: hypothetical protein ACK4TA_06280 [Saprospiraceae bacterium]
MMKLAYKWSLALLLLIAVSSVVRAGDDEKREFTKVIKKEFDITKNGTTALYNKYGKIDVKTWDKNRVKVDVTILVNASSESAAQKVFDRIDIKFVNSEGYVKAETIIETTKSSWWEGWNTGNNRSDYSINYEVYMPATNNLELGNRYGDTYVAAIEGVANIDVKYGNIKMQGVGNNAKLVLAYGNGSLVKANNVTADLSYSSMSFGEVRDADITSKYSPKVKFDKVANIRCNTKYDTYEIVSVRELRNDGKYDNFRIGSAENVVAVSKYTQVNVDNLKNQLDVTMEYGGCSVGLLDKDFTNVNLIGKYSDFKITVQDGANFKMDASSNYAGITYPAALNVSHEIEKGTSHEVKGHVGKQDARSTIVARVNYGGLKVRQE